MCKDEHCKATQRVSDGGAGKRSRGRCVSCCELTNVRLRGCRCAEHGSWHDSMRSPSQTNTDPEIMWHQGVAGSALNHLHGLMLLKKTALATSSICRPCMRLNPYKPGKVYKSCQQHPTLDALRSERKMMVALCSVILQQ